MICVRALQGPPRLTLHSDSADPRSTEFTVPRPELDKHVFCVAHENIGDLRLQEE